MKIKEIDTCSAFCWRPYRIEASPSGFGPLLAACNLAGSMGENFSNNPHLQVRQVSSLSRGMSMPLVGYAALPEKAQKVDWSAYPAGCDVSVTGRFSNNGIIAAGMVDGVVRAWDADLLMSNYARKRAEWAEREAAAGRGTSAEGDATHETRGALDDVSAQEALPADAEDEFGQFSLGNGGAAATSGGVREGFAEPIFFTDESEFDGVSYYNPVLCNIDAHPNAGLNCLTFNPSRAEIFATAGSNDQQLKIWTLESPTEPKFVPAFAQGSDTARGAVHRSEITDCRWNPKYESILGSVTSGGTFHLFDLRTSKETHSITHSNAAAPANSFTNNSVSLTRGSATALAWHPSGTTMVAIARTTTGLNSNSAFTNRMMMSNTAGISAGGPVVQIWDLKRAVAPVLEFGLPLLPQDSQFYQALVANPMMGSGCGANDMISGISWSHEDPRLLLSAGSDGKVACWDTTTGELLSVPVLAEGGCIISDVKWLGASDATQVSKHGHSSPAGSANASLFAISSFDNKTSVFGMHDPTDRSALVAVTGDFAPKRPSACPHWLGRTAGGALGFGGRAVFAGRDGTIMVRRVAPAAVRRVFNESDKEAKEVATAEAQFQSQMAQASGDPHWIATITARSGTLAGDAPEKNIFNVLATSMRTSSRRPLMDFLGFDVSTIRDATLALTERLSVCPISSGTIAMPRTLLETKQHLADYPAEEEPAAAKASEGDEFDFSAMPQQMPTDAAELTGEPEAREPHQRFDIHQASASEIQEEYAVVYELLTKCVAVALLPEAVELCLAAQIFDDAFAIASLMGTKEVLRVRDAYFASSELAASTVGWATTSSSHALAARKQFISLLQAATTREFNKLFGGAVACLIGHGNSAFPSWRSTLSLIASFANTQEFTASCKALGSELEAAASSCTTFSQQTAGSQRDYVIDAAATCFIVCVEVDTAVRLWCEQLSRLESEAAAASKSTARHSVEPYSNYRVGSVQEIAHTATVLEMASGRRIGCSEFADILGRLAITLLNDSNDYAAALSYAVRAAQIGSGTGAMVADRIQHALPRAVPAGMRIPAPFQSFNLPENSSLPEIRRIQQNMQRPTGVQMHSEQQQRTQQGAVRSVAPSPGPQSFQRQSPTAPPQGVQRGSGTQWNPPTPPPAGAWAPTGGMQSSGSFRGQPAVSNVPQQQSPLPQAPNTFSGGYVPQQPVSPLPPPVDLHQRQEALSRMQQPPPQMPSPTPSTEMRMNASQGQQFAIPQCNTGPSIPRGPDAMSAPPNGNNFSAPSAQPRHPQPVEFSLDTSGLSAEGAQLVAAVAAAANRIAEKRRRDAVEKSAIQLLNCLRNNALSEDLIALLNEYTANLGSSKGKEMWKKIAEKHSKSIQSFIQLRFL